MPDRNRPIPVRRLYVALVVIGLNPSMWGITLYGIIINNAYLLGKPVFTEFRQEISKVKHMVVSKQ